MELISSGSVLTVIDGTLNSTHRKRIVAVCRWQRQSQDTRLKVGVGIARRLDGRAGLLLGIVYWIF